MSMSETNEIRVAVDAIVFGYQQNTLHALLVKQKFGQMKGTWVLPGGFVLKHESLKEAVTRELQEEAGIKVNYLEQLYTFGDDIHRDPRFRVISVAYFALVNPNNFALVHKGLANLAPHFEKIFTTNSVKDIEGEGVEQIQLREILTK